QPCHAYRTRGLARRGDLGHRAIDVLVAVVGLADEQERGGVLRGPRVVERHARLRDAAPRPALGQPVDGDEEGGRDHAARHPPMIGASGGWVSWAMAEPDEPIGYMERTRDWYLALGYGNPYRWA